MRSHDVKANTRMDKHSKYFLFTAKKQKEMAGKDLEYWKHNAEDNYDQVPISVLRYIRELEKFAKKISVKLLENGVYLLQEDDEIIYFKKEKK